MKTTPPIQRYRFGDAVMIYDQRDPQGITALVIDDISDLAPVKVWRKGAITEERIKREYIRPMPNEERELLEYIFSNNNLSKLYTFSKHYPINQRNYRAAVELLKNMPRNPDDVIIEARVYRNH